MEMNEKDVYNLSYQNSNFLPETGHSIPPISQASQIAADPYWNSTPRNSTFCENPIPGPSGLHLGWNPSSPFPKGVPFLPPSLSNMQADSGFIERAARFSCFNSGNLGAMLGTFSNFEPLGPHSNPSKGLLDQKKIEENLAEASKRVGMENKETGEPESSGIGQEEGQNISNNKKRKRPNQGNEANQGETTQQLPMENSMKENVEREEKSEEKKNSGKQPKESSDVAKEEYIHVRARRGQATNSHSLAERVRREKISERMKYLQDLVPGCSKVTGKAVMLDEIINYVQSLQRQVEFLSMKLAAINPRLDFNIESLLSKNIFNPNAGPASAMGFLSEAVHPQLALSQQGLVQAGIPPILLDQSDALRRIANAQVGPATGYKDHTNQIPNSAWEGEFHNVMQMAYPPLNTQELNVKSRDGFTG